MKRIIYISFGIVALFIAGYLLAYSLPPELRPYFFNTREARPGLKSITSSYIKSSVSVLASDSLRGRYSTFPGQKKAAKFIKSELQSLGIKPLPGLGSYYQKFTLERVSLSDSQRAHIYTGSDTTLLSYSNDFYVSPSGIYNSQEISGKLVFAGYGISSSRYNYDDYAPINVRDKWLMVIEGEPQLHNSKSIFNGAEPTRWSRIRTKKWKANQSGAAGLIVVSNNFHGSSQRAFGEILEEIQQSMARPFMKLPDTERTNFIPLILISHQLADSLLIASSGKSLSEYQASIDASLEPVSFPLDMSLDVEIGINKIAAQTENVVGIHEGANPKLRDNYVILTAHYDHMGAIGDSIIYHGADDNASGTAGVLAVARAFAQNPVKPERSVIFALLSAEELGLLGSQYFTDNPPVELDSITANVNMDMIGRNARDSIFVIGSNMLSWDLHNISEIARHHVRKMHFDFKYNDVDDPQRLYYRSDHYNFAKYDIPSLFFFSGLHEDYHRPTDTTEKVDFVKAARVSKVAFLTAWGVANFEERLELDGQLVEDYTDTVSR
ncbi:MAG: M20/M25/M40 family metallo-hydrolase [Candidatus Marinimicrobia bacterium]|nr:M20/M25/M40 family metallo-hydrolase [Candidatus Neomarinimicrobiota bacterium]